ncbi:MAG: MBL fold metallo-hydrolase [Betaproteobacteria bacterium]|nr:MBL fold metallo-hydrolase [Betaproteobacteria bacterium]
MRNLPRIGFLSKVLAALLLTAQAALWGAVPAQGGPVKVEWLGWSFYRFTSPSGKVVLTNPFITGNADAAVKLEEITQADLILVTDAHRDEVGDAVAIAKATGARIVTPSFEFGTVLAAWGVPNAQVMRRNPGGRYTWEGITIRVVGAVHGSAATDPSSKFPIYGGVAAGFMVTFENGYTVYFMGSSAATQDMALWAELYKPDAMIFLMSGFTEPLDVGTAIKLVAGKSPNLKTLIPHHQRVAPPPGALTVAEVRATLDSMGIRIPITDPVRKQVYEFTK